MALTMVIGAGAVLVCATRFGFKLTKAALPLWDALNAVGCPKLKYWQPEIARAGPKIRKL
ncbi:hypothetical protein MPLB_1760062 [Mesorhizobium sp. ORS 3324]|nr:hypothetical protein MPLB_1760062 [Mesorhizobium sp. ORS 3324]